jgi:hypothetical protein
MRLDQLLERGQFAFGIEERPAKMRLARVDLILKTHWMAELIDSIDFASDASLDHLAHVA